jgi:hypothetical protein
MIENLADLAASVDIKVITDETVKNKPSKATSCRRRISPLPILQVPECIQRSSVFPLFLVAPYFVLITI